MKTECFNTQEQILNHLGKKNDRNLIQRMIRSGKIYKEDGMYYLVVEEDTDSLKERIKELEKENRKLKEESKITPEHLESTGKVLENQNKVKEMIDHLTYLYTRLSDRKVAMKSIIDSYYAAYNSQKYSRDDFEEQLYKKIGFIADTQDDEDEIVFICKFIKENR